jgi:hypothetical protein
MFPPPGMSMGPPPGMSMGPPGMMRPMQPQMHPGYPQVGFQCAFWFTPALNFFFLFSGKNRNLDPLYLLSSSKCAPGLLDAVISQDCGILRAWCRSSFREQFFFLVWRACACTFVRMLCTYISTTKQRGWKQTGTDILWSSSSGPAHEQSI